MTRWREVFVSLSKSAIRSRQIEDSIDYAQKNDYLEYAVLSGKMVIAILGSCRYPG